MDQQGAPPRSRKWIYATVILCCYGFFKELKPSEAFLTPYLVDSKNFSNDVVSSQIYPFWTYSYLVSAVFVFLLTDILRYKPVILLESAAYLSTRILLIWGTSVFSMQVMQMVYGIATATEIAYFSYIYAAVSVIHFKKATSYVRAVRLFSQSCAGIMGQILWQTKVVSLRGLNYISFGSVCVACIFAVFLPNVSSCSSLSCCRRSGVDMVIQASHEESSEYSANLCLRLQVWFKTVLRNHWRDFVKFYSKLHLLRWSIWWALATCGWLQVGNYVQTLWEQVAEEAGTSYDYNGLAEALATLSGAAAAFILSYLKVNWPVWGEMTIGVLSLADSLLLLVASSAHELWLAYLCHILFRTTYAFLITIASVQLAYAVDHNSYALIFGLNSCVALILQTCLTVVVADKHGLNLDVRTQFVVYGGYYYVLTAIFMAAGVYKLTTTGWRQSFRVFFRESVPIDQRKRSFTVQNPSEEERKLLNSTEHW